MVDIYRRPDDAAHVVELVKSGTFDVWLTGLRDRKARAIILVRLDRLAAGNPGDVRSVGAGLSEMRIAFGPGYRIYFKRVDGSIVLLLAGGDKSSQQADITRARHVAQQWEDARA